MQEAKEQCDIVWTACVFYPPKFAR